jgi:cell division septation protein DedD
MTERETESRRSKSRPRGPGLARYLYGALLVAIGACIGIVIGSTSETPRVLLERLRGPVETVELEAPPPSAEPPASPPLEAFDELQGAPAKPVTAPPAPKPAPAPAKPAATVAKAAAAPAPAAAPKPPATPQVSAPPPPAAPAKSAEELVREMEKKSVTPPAKGTVVQVLSLAERKQADALVAKLKTQGFDPYVSPMPDKSGRFRVRVRPSGGQSPAELEARLKTLGLKTWATAE